MATNPTTGMEDLTEVNKLTGAFPAAQKGYIGPKELAPALKEVSQKEAVAQEELAKSDIRVEKAKREEEATKAEKMKGFYEGEKKALEELPERAAYKKSVEELNAAKFEPTKDTLQDIAGLFSLMGVVGTVLGKGNATQAMYAMNGMMEGHIKGRKDLVKQQALEFDKNFKALQTKVDASYKELQDAISLRMYDQRAGQEAITMAIARSESPLLKEMEARQGPMRTLAFLKDVKDNTLGNMVKLNNDLRAKADERERQREATASRERIASLRSVGSKSANSERFAGNVYRSANEVLRSLELIEQIGINTGGGALGQVVGKGSIPSEVQRYIGQSFTEEQERNYNTAMSGVALEMAFVLNGGYKPDVAIQQKLENYLSVGPNDTRGSAAYKFADTVAKLKAAIETTPSFNETQKETKQKLLEKFENYATPEVVYTRAYGIQPRSEPILQNQQNYPRPQTKADFDALPPDALYIDPDDYKLYRKPRK